MKTLRTVAKRYFGLLMIREMMAYGPHDTVRDFWAVRNLGDVLAILALSDLSGPINVAVGKGVRSRKSAN